MDSRSSRTALLTAAYRAAHQSVDAERVFIDPLALRVLGPEERELLEAVRRDSWLARFMRFNLAARSGYTETLANEAIASGVEQIVVLGAGFDTFCYRVRGPRDLRLFEVDHPLTQREKRGRLDAAGIEAPDSLSYVEVDFEREGLTDKLSRSGFDPARPAFIIWLGVIYYLAPQAAQEVLATIGDWPGAVEMVFDYHRPRDIAGFNALAPDVREAIEKLLRDLAEWGEPVRNYLEPDAMRGDLRRCGFTQIDDLAPEEINACFRAAAPARYSSTPTWRIVRARKPAAAVSDLA